MRLGFLAARLFGPISSWSSAQDPASVDLLEELVFHYEAPLDQPAIEASVRAGAAAGAIEAGVAVSSASEPARQLALLQADFSLLAEGLETFRDPESTANTLKRVSRMYVPELARFFKDRDSSLDALYRLLAVADYTWALRFPDAGCDPEKRRAELLSSKDGLFADPKTGRWRPWVAKTLELDDSGEAALGRFRQTLTEASLRPQDYEALRLRVRELVGALSSAEVSGAARAGLYCERGDVYERLGASHRHPGEADNRAASAQALRAYVHVLMVAEPAGSGFQALGAAVLVRQGQGVSVLTDAGVVLDPATGLVRTGLVAFAMGPKRNEPPPGPYPLTIERIDRRSRLAVAGFKSRSDLFGGLQIASSEAALGDLVLAVGHGSLTGAWTVSQGLVTASGRHVYRSDATLLPDFGGSALINEAGELVGVAVLSDSGVHALQPSTLKVVLEGGEAAEFDAAELGSDGSQGSAAILTPAKPLEAACLVSESGGLIETGLPSNLGGVAWDGGGSGIGSFRFRPSTTRYSGSGSSSWSSGSSSYEYDPDSRYAQFGRRIGTAIRESIGKFLTWLFTPRSKVSFPAKPAMTVQAHPKPVKPPPPPPPPPKPKIAGLSLTASPSSLTTWGSVTLTAEVSLDQADKPRSGLPVVFEAPSGWDLKFPGSSKDRTDSSGRATAAVEIRKPKGAWKEEPLVFTARVSGSGEVQGSASASVSVIPVPKPRITGLTLTLRSDTLRVGQIADVTAQVSVDAADAPLSGLTVSLFAEPEPASRLDQRHAVTDALGRAVFRADILAVPAQALRLHAEVAGTEHVIGKARAEAFLTVKPTVQEEVRRRGETAFGALDREGRKAKGPCPDGYKLQAKKGSKTAAAGNEPQGGSPGQGPASNPEEAKAADECRQAILQAAFQECLHDEACRKEKLKELGYDDCQLRPVLQPGGPGMLNSKTPGPAVQVAGDGGDDECVPEDDDGKGLTGGTAYKSESEGKPERQGDEGKRVENSGPTSLDAPESLRGSTKEQVEALIPKDWEVVPARNERGTRYFKPGTKRSVGVRIMEGNPNAPDAYHQGPRVIITNGEEPPISMPLQGNSTLP